MREAAKWLVNYIAEHGHLLEQWDADAKAVQLAQTLHSGAWFSVGDSVEVVTSSTGGRQGCKLGSTTFNSAYALALGMLSAQLADAGVALKLTVPSEAVCLTSSSPGVGDENIVDAAFVDDECLVLMAPTPHELDMAIDTVLKSVTTVFSLLHLEINWAAGKTECFVKYRGHHAVRHREQWRTDDGKLSIPVPGSDRRLAIVGTCALQRETHTKTHKHVSKVRWLPIVRLPRRSLAPISCRPDIGCASWQLWLCRGCYSIYTSRCRSLETCKLSMRCACVCCAEFATRCEQAKTKCKQTSRCAPTWANHLQTASLREQG